MFIDGKIQKSILHSTSLNELASILDKNYRYINIYQDDIKKVIEYLVDYEDSNHINLALCKTLCDDIYSDPSKPIDRVKVDILSCYINKIVMKYSNLDAFIELPGDTIYRVFLYTLISAETIKHLMRVYTRENYEDLYFNFYMTIFDIYIPSEFSDFISHKFSNIPFKEIYDALSQVNSRKFVDDLFIEYKNMEEYQSIILDGYKFLKYLKDVTYNNIARQDMSYKVIDILSSNNKDDYLRNICNKYQKYFNIDTYYTAIKFLTDIELYNLNVAITKMITELSFIHNTDDNGALTVLVYNNMDIVELFIKDILANVGIINDHVGEIISLYTNIIRATDIVPEDEKIIADESLLDFPEGLYNPFEEIEEPSGVMEAVNRDSKTMHSMQNKIYAAYKNYENSEQKIDSQLSKAIIGAKKLLIGDTRKVIIEGKEFSALGLLKKLLAGVAIFSYSKMAFIIAIIVRYTLKKNTTRAERQKILMELQEELEIINEKIEDAKGDGNRKAKYSLMRTRNDLQNAINRIKYGIEVDKKALGNARKAIEK